jgi:polyketide synthase 12
VDQPVVPLGRPRAERADAARNRLHLLAVAREMLASHDADKLTMDGLAEQAGLGKGTVFRRFGSRAGIFRALLNEDEYEFQRQLLSGPAPLGPGAEPLERLIAYGKARAAFLISRGKSPVLLWTAANRCRRECRRPCRSHTSGCCSAR